MMNDWQITPLKKEYQSESVGSLVRTNRGDMLKIQSPKWKVMTFFDTKTKYYYYNNDKGFWIETRSDKPNLSSVTVHYNWLNSPLVKKRLIIAKIQRISDNKIIEVGKVYRKRSDYLTDKPEYKVEKIDSDGYIHSQNIRTKYFYANEISDIQ